MKRLITPRLIRRGVLLGAGLIASSASAYDWNGNKWNIAQGQSVPYVVNVSLSTDLPDPDALAAVQQGYDVWTVLPCSYMAWNYEGRTMNSAWGAGDGENVASWREENWGDSPTALGIAATSFSGDGGLLDTDVKFNGVDHSWAAFPNGFSGGDGRTDIASVSAHEAGHCIGLGHSAVAGSTMWPSTGPGDIGGRSLGEDDILGACEVYPSGGEVPPPDMDPPVVPGMVEFGGDCSMERCVEGLFCVSDGRESYCTQPCRPGGDECGEGFYCAELAQGDGACARGEDPVGNRAGFGEACGANVRCDAGLICVDDEGEFYCTGPCANGMCPGDYFCSELSNGNDICARGVGGGPLPGLAEPCTERGLCDQGLFCLNDPLWRDEDSGDVVPYCTSACEDDMCPDGFRCIDVPPSNTACQRIPTPGERDVGDPCWVNPERPFDPPSCGDGMVCIDFQIVDQEIVERGTCTKNCSPDNCCPSGWGCLELTPVFAQCAEGRTDDPEWACNAAPEGGAGGDGAGGEGGVIGVGGEGGDGPNQDGGGDSGGCTAQPGAPVSGWWALLLLGGLARRRRCAR